MTTLKATTNPTDRRCASGTRNEIPVGAIGIRLTNGMIALVDEADYPKVQGFTWQAIRSCDGNYVRWYAYTKVARTRKSIRMHRLLLNPPTGMVVDHKNHDGLDNRRSNLRVCTQSQNLGNMRPKKRRVCPSPYKGVFKEAGKNRRWRAYIWLNGKSVCLGFFDTEEEAAKAYDIAAVKKWGAFARVNFPSPQAM